MEERTPQFLNFKEVFWLIKKTELVDTTSIIGKYYIKLALPKTDLLSLRYPEILQETPGQIFDDKDFEDYEYLYEDYNLLTCREIKKGNIKAVFLLCSEISSRSFPWFEPMMECALQYATYDMFVFVFWMWQVWWEERDKNLSYEEAVKLVKNPDKDKKLDLMDYMKVNYGVLCIRDCDMEDSDDEDSMEGKYEEEVLEVDRHLTSKIVRFEEIINVD